MTFIGLPLPGMLMEGVVLYVVLVRVFVKRKRLYMLGFTLVSYGVPVVYMGLITLPLGYALPQANASYGYDTWPYIPTTCEWIFYEYL